MVASITPYKRGNYPIIEGNDRVFFDDEFRKIEQTLRQITAALKTTPFLGDFTIATGVVTVTSPSPTLITYVQIDTQAAAATDDLDTITWNSAEDGQILIIYANNSARTVVVKDGTGNMKLAGDMSLDNADDSITIQYFAGTFYELARSNNSA